jgi:hypothetical protein
LALAAGWWWHGCQEPEYVAHARLTVPALADVAPGNDAAPNAAESLLSPEVIAAASDLLRERGIALPYASPLDSEVDELLHRLQATHEVHGERAELNLSYRTPEAPQAVPVLTAVVDAGLRALQSAAPPADDPDASSREREREQLGQAVERQRAQAAALQDQVANREREEGSDALVAERTRSCAAALEAACARRLEAEQRLAHARRDIQAGADCERIMAKLPDGADWSATRELVDASLQRHELRKQEAAVRQAAAIYGRNHPRMVELRTQVARLRQNVAAIQMPADAPAIVLASAVGSASTARDDEQLPPGELLLKLLAEKSWQAIDAEEDAGQQLAAATMLQDERQVLVAQLAAARQELGFLQKEHDQVQRRVDEARREVERSRADIVESPTLSPDSVVPSLSLYLAIAGSAGTVVSIGCWRRFRRSLAREAARSRSALLASKNNLAPERFRSQEEAKLVQRARLAATG